MLLNDTVLSPKLINKIITMVLKSMGAEEKVCVLFPYCLLRGKSVKFQVVDFSRCVHTLTFQVYMH